VGFVTQSARFYCRPVRDHSWAHYFFVSVNQFVACYRRYSPVRSTTTIQDLLFSLYILCRHNVLGTISKTWGIPGTLGCWRSYWARWLQIRWFVVRRLILRYFTPPLLSRFPIIRLYCYSFPSSFYSNLFGQSWIGLPVNVPGSGCHGSTPRVLVASLDQTLTEDLLPFLVLHLSLVLWCCISFLSWLEDWSSLPVKCSGVRMFTSLLQESNWPAGNRLLCLRFTPQFVYSPLMLYFDRYMSQLNFGTKIILTWWFW